MQRSPPGVVSQRQSLEVGRKGPDQERLLRPNPAWCTENRCNHPCSHPETHLTHHSYTACLPPGFTGELSQNQGGNNPISTESCGEHRGRDTGPPGGWHPPDTKTRTAMNKMPKTSKSSPETCSMRLQAGVVAGTQAAPGQKRPVTQHSGAPRAVTRTGSRRGRRIK